LNDRIYIGVTAVTDRPDTVRSLTRYLSRRTQSSPKNLDELKHQPTPLLPLPSGAAVAQYDRLVKIYGRLGINRQKTSYPECDLQSYVMHVSV